ncbi:MAG: hypothetical protein RL154_1495 [Pseudomonadota bacterium]|jgi:ABC-type long-subunit fatty acid transport system fused permease/ATPase subunit
MFCAERIQRVMMAAMLMLSFYLISIGNSLGMAILAFIIFMVIVWAFTDFCPSIAILKKIIGSCDDKKDSKGAHCC